MSFWIVFCPHVCDLLRKRYERIAADALFPQPGQLLPEDMHC